MSSLKPFIRAFSLVYTGVLTSMVIFVVAVFFINQNGVISEDALRPDMASAYRYGLVGLVLVGLLAGHFIYKSLLSKIDPSISVREKFLKLQAITLIRAACYEIPGLFGAIAAFRTGDNSFLLFSAIMLAFLILFWPTTEKIIQDLQLSDSERMEME